MTVKEEKIRDQAVQIWQAAYMDKGLFWPRDRAFRYADKKSGRYIFNQMEKA